MKSRWINLLFPLSQFAILAYLLYFLITKGAPAWITPCTRAKLCLRQAVLCR